MSSFELEGRALCLVVTPWPGRSSTGQPSGEPTFTERILALLDQIRAGGRDNGRGPNGEIRGYKRAIAEVNNHASATEVARRIIDQIDE
jgi:hypothetical protein